MLEIHLGGHLSFYTPDRRGRFNLVIDRNTTLSSILERLDIPLAEVALAAVNGEMAVIETALVQPGDRIDLYPPMGGG
jgi:sulfur carrier protein ThiS